MKMEIISELTDPDYKEKIQRNITAIKKELPDSVTLVAVTKKHTVDETQAVVDAGVYDLGENREQDLMAKKDKIEGPVRWHFIGHLQSNKVKYLIGQVYLIHSISSMKLINKVESESAKKDTVTDILLQFNLAGEDTKSGFAAADLEAAAAKVESCPHVRLRGLMCIGPMTENSHKIHEIFAQLKKMYDKIKITYNGGDNHIDTLSMGMTNDYPIAVEEGATMIRVGRKIFQR
jgi:pyridoxal phosphate enzyme (YggS family)